MIEDVAQITAVERSLLTPHCRSLGAMRRLPELWFKYNILTESTRLPFSVTEHAAFSLPRVIFASRCIKLEGGAMSTVNEYHAYARDCLRWAARARTEEQRERLLSLARHWRQAALELEGVSIAPAPTAPTLPPPHASPPAPRGS